MFFGSWAFWALSSAVQALHLLEMFMCFGMRHTPAFMLKSVKCEKSILLLHSRISIFSTDITLILTYALRFELMAPCETLY